MQAAATAHIAQPRGATPRPRSGAEAGRTPCPRGSGQEELTHVQGQGQWPRARDCDGAGMAERSYPTSEVRGSSREELPRIQCQGRWPRVPGCDSTGAAKRSYPTSEARGGGREEQPHVQGAVAARGQEGLEELFHVQGQEGQW